MADGVEELGFWLPTEFLDELCTDEPAVGKTRNEAFFGSAFCFSKDFSYEATNGGEKGWAATPTSPQSTLSRLSSFSRRGSTNGSPNGVTSPPTTPLSLAVEDLIHSAVGQVEMLKLSGGVSPPGNLRQRQRISGMWYAHQHQQAPASGKVSGNATWADPTRMSRPGLPGPGNNGVVKRACAGTGVFLPRRYDNDEKIYNSNVGSYAADPRKKTAAMVPPHRAIRAPPPSKLMGQVNGTLDSNYDMLMARRRLMMLRLQQQQQQLRRNMMMEVEESLGVYLPQEWTY